ncbi:hypothetical protein HPB47_004955 [Ixodes persulcatus]|uniref:Uncharacterized protein n=1 Tax=Ixodes persulcatus TaxID=34615 RepID=A0AC60PES7_IXOPE|nr:hypothetical protein HPB47_004955 [Ixodes persulcatus]
MSVVLYSCEPSVPCRVVRMVAQHIGIALTIKEVDIAAGDTQLKDFLKLNPAHTVPTMVDGNIILYESRAIVTYLIEKYAAGSSMYPRDIEKRAMIDNLLMFDIGTLYRPCLPTSPNDRRSGSDRAASVRQPLRLTGAEISLADIAVAGTLSFVDAAAYSLDAHPKVRDYYIALKQELPYFTEINDKGIAMFRKYAQK